MPIEQHTCYSARCDQCRTTYEDISGVTLHYDSAAEATSNAEGYDWGKVSDGRLLCDNCVYAATRSGELEECEDSTHLDHAFHPGQPQGVEQS